MIRTKQIEPISNDALIPDIKIGSLAALPVTLDTSSITAALTSLYTALKTTFIALNDTPATYAGQAYKFTKVAQAENALQFSSMRENAVGNIGINYSGSMGSLAYRMFIDDSVVTNSAALSINKNYGYTALEVTSGAGAHGLTVQTDSGDIAQFTGQYSGAMVVRYNGRVGIGLSSPSNRLHVAWRSGDTVSTMYAGSSATGNNQTAIDAESYSAAAIRGNTITGSYAMQGISSANGSFGIYGFSPTASGVKGTGAVYGGWFESSAGTGLYVHTGSVRFAPLGGSGTRMVIADSSGILGVQSLPTSGITSLNSLTGASQTFTNDSNVTITSSGSTHTLGWTGQLSIARGGTGASTATAALTNLLPVQTGNTGKALVTDGTSASWQSLPASGITSLGGLTGTTQTFANDSNVTITSSGSTHTLGWNGQLTISRGGTGAATASVALTNLLPVQTGNTGKALLTDGTSASWQSLPASGITSLGGLTGTTQTFTNDSNVTITSSGSTHTLGWSGLLSIGRGGTGASTATIALTNLLPAQTGNTGKALVTDGTSASWQSLPASGITSLGGLTGTTQTFANDANVTITSSGSTHTLGWSGLLSIGRGGTGASTANAALNNLLPAQAGNSGTYLYSNGTNTSWKGFPKPSQTRFVSAGFIGLSAPYYTSIQAAIDDAISGDLVEVFTGTYSEYLTLKNGVNLYLHTGVTVRYEGSTYHTITANNTDCSIDGFGSIEHDASTNLSVIGITGTSNVILRCHRLDCQDGQNAVYMTSTGTAAIYADEITGTGPTIIEMTSGTLEITARRIEQLDTTATLLLQSGGTLRISDTLLVGSYPTPTGTGGLLNKSGGTMILSGCTIVNNSTSSPVYSIGASTAQAVKIYHCVTNKPAHANISFPVQALVVDADVS